MNTAVKTQAEQQNKMVKITSKTPIKINTNIEKAATCYKGNKKLEFLC